MHAMFMQGGPSQVDLLDGQPGKVVAGLLA
jgi:hypothetical protein